MKKIIYGIALLVCVITFVLCVIQGISLLTSLFRSAIVFLGVLFIFFMAANVLHWGMLLTPRNQQVKDNR